MILSRELLAYFSTWGVNLLFCFALIPQVIRNYKMRSTDGLSDLMIWFSFTGYISNILYAYCLRLPYSYRIMMPLSLFIMTIIVFQRFMYHTGLKNKNKRLFIAHISSVLVAAILLFLVPEYRFVVGNVAGWACVCIWSFYQVPQIIKIYGQRSVRGFSFFLPFCIGLGEIIESVSAIILKMPVQTICNDLYGILIFLIITIQFLVYTKKLHKTRSVKPFEMAYGLLSENGKRRKSIRTPVPIIVSELLENGERKKAVRPEERSA